MKDLKLNSITDLKNEGKSFYWASFFLPKKAKKNAGLLYSICRYFDNIADNNEKDETLFLKKSIEQIKEDKDNVVNIFLTNNNIEISIFIDLIEGLILDQKDIVIKDRNELIKYSYCVAGTVGLMMSKIIGVVDNKAAPCAIDLGIAMQITNIVRDVFEDAKMKRIYIPLDSIPNIDISILNGKSKLSERNEKQICEAIHGLIDLSEQFYKNGFSGLKYIPFKTRLGIFIAANVYRGIGIKIKYKKKVYIRKRIYLNLFEKILITIRSISIFIFIPLINYRYRKIRNNFPNENI